MIELTKGPVLVLNGREIHKESENFTNIIKSKLNKYKSSR